MKTICTITLFILVFNGKAQDLIEISFGGSLDSSRNFIEAFNFDFNRSDEVKSDVKNTYALGNGSGPWLFRPSTSVNLGGGTNSSSNNVLAQANFFRICNPKTKQKTNKDVVLMHQCKIDLPVSYESDKDFRERLLYQQIRLNYNPIRTKSMMRLDTLKSKRVLGVMVNPYLNIGSRNSRDFKSWNFYSVAGVHLEWYYRIRPIDGNSAKEKYSFKLQVDGLYILKEAEQFKTVDPFRYSATASFNYQISKAFKIGFSIETGTITPKYERYNNGQITLIFDPF